MSPQDMLRLVSRLNAIACEFPESSSAIAGLTWTILHATPRHATNGKATTNGHASTLTTNDKATQAANGRATREPCTCGHDADTESQPSKKRAIPNGNQSRYKPREYREKMCKELCKDSKGPHSPTEFGRMFNRSEMTVGLWCRQGRINAKLVLIPNFGGRRQWQIPESEVERYDNEGLLPVDFNRNK